MHRFAFRRLTARELVKISFQIWAVNIIKFHKVKSWKLSTWPYNVKWTEGEAAPVEAVASVATCNINNTLSVLFAHLAFTVTPSSGHQLGGTPVVVTGLTIQEQDDVNCVFDQSRARGTYINSNTTFCVSPRLNRRGLITFRIEVNGVLLGPLNYTSFQVSRLTLWTL